MLLSMTGLIELFAKLSILGIVTTNSFVKFTRRLRLNPWYGWLLLDVLKKTKPS